MEQMQRVEMHPIHVLVTLLGFALTRFGVRSLALGAVQGSLGSPRASAQHHYGSNPPVQKTYLQGIPHRGCITFPVRFVPCVQGIHPTSSCPVLSRVSESLPVQVLSTIPCHCGLRFSVPAELGAPCCPGRASGGCPHSLPALHTAQL